MFALFKRDCTLVAFCAVKTGNSVSAGGIINHGALQIWLSECAWARSAGTEIDGAQVAITRSIGDEEAKVAFKATISDPNGTVFVDGSPSKVIMFIILSFSFWAAGQEKRPSAFVRSVGRSLTRSFCPDRCQMSNFKVIFQCRPNLYGSQAPALRVTEVLWLRGDFLDVKMALLLGYKNWSVRWPTVVFISPRVSSTAKMIKFFLSLDSFLSPTGIVVYAPTPCLLCPAWHMIWSCYGLGLASLLAVRQPVRLASLPAG